MLRLITLGTVPDNLFYDASVRSMTMSLHNFLYGAFDPSAATAIDKPPIDLWLQVIAVKLFGFNSVALKLPEAIAGTARGAASLRPRAARRGPAGGALPRRSP